MPGVTLSESSTYIARDTDPFACWVRDALLARWTGVQCDPLQTDSKPAPVWYSMKLGEIEASGHAAGTPGRIFSYFWVPHQVGVDMSTGDQLVSEESITVFLVDDHVMVREGLAAILAKDPQITVVGQVGEGLKVLEELTKVHPDIVILDITMPGLNGLDVCRELTRKCKDTLVLILTMHDNIQFVARALAYGASGYLLKESAADELTEAVRAVARGELYLGSGIPKDVLQRIGKGGRDPYELLTARERQVLQLIAEGKTNRQISEALDVTVKTIDTHRSHLMKKLNIHDQTTLVKFALRKGIVSLQ